MADIDLYGGDAQRIRNQYRTSLGRDASDNEVSGWLSGSYGGGGTNDWLQQIQNSGEAQSYRGSQADAPVIGPSFGENHGFDQPAPSQQSQGGDQIAQWYQQYLGRGPEQNDVSQWLSGAYGWGDANNLQGILSGISGSAEAKARPQRTTTTTTPTTPYQNTDWWGTQGVSSSDIFDLSTGQMNPGWTRTANGYERAAGTTNTQGPKNGDFEGWFAQLTNGKPPTPENLEALAPMLAQFGIKLGSKGDRGWTDTIILPDGRTFDVIEAAGIGTGKRWTFQQNGGPGFTLPQTPGPQYSDPNTKFLEQLLQQMIQMRMQPVQDPNRAIYEAMLKQRADALGQAEAPYQQLMKYLQERFTDLQGSGYTGAENEVIRTGALDPIETDRQAARKRMIERLSARGLTPDSGIAQQALLEIDKAFDALRGTTQTALTTNDLNRREDRKQRAQTIGAQLVDIPQFRAREQLDVFAALDQMSRLARQEDEARQREAAAYSGQLADLGPQRLQLAMQAAGMGGNPSSTFGNLMQLAGLNQNAAMYGAQNQNNQWSALGSFVETLMRAGH
jgi:hypothetical protein